LVHPLDSVAQSLAGGFGQDFYTITSRNDQAFSYNLPIDERMQACRARLFRERETLAYFDGRGLVIDSN
jgi:hypothetical protein